MFKAITNPRVLRVLLPLKSLTKGSSYKFPKSIRSFQAPLFVQYFSSEAAPSAKPLIQDAYDALDSSNIEKAQSNFQAALNLIAKQSPENFEEKAQALVGFASLSTITGQPNQAIAQLQQAEQALKQSDVEDKTVASHLYYLMGRNFREIENYDEALKYSKLALDVQKQISSEEGSQIGLMYSNVGAIYHKKGDLEEAKTHLVKAVQCFENEVSQDDPQLSFLTYELGQVFLKKTEFEDALKYLKKAEKVLKTEANVRQTFSAELHYHLGVASEGCGDLENAMEYYLNAYEIGLKPFEDPADKENIAKLMEAIGMRMMEINQADDAIDPLMRALELYREIESDNGMNVALVCHYLGLAHASRGDIAGGIQFLEHALELKLKAFGEGDVEVGFAHQSLGASYCAVGKFQEAIEQLDKAFAILRKGFGEDHPVCKETIETRNQAASQLQQQQKK